MQHDTTRWTVSVSKDIDVILRSFLAQRGMKKGDISKFVEDAVRRRVLDQTLTELREKFPDVPPEVLQQMIDEAALDVRDETHRSLFQRVRHLQDVAAVNQILARDNTPDVPIDSEEFARRCRVMQELVEETERLGLYR